MARPTTVPRAGFFSLLTLLAVAAGCTATRSLIGVETPPASPPAKVDGTRAPDSTRGPGASSAADSARVRGAADSLTSALPAPKPRPATRGDTLGGERAEATSGSDSLGGTATETTPIVAEPAAISVELGAEETAELEQRIAEDLDHAEQSIRALRRDEVTGDERVRLETAETLIQDARRERAEGDLRAAATLAHKARLLAEELSK